ncbi:MAG: hypothetical protein AAFU64_01320 [Bacteroidota bacterium]
MKYSNITGDGAVLKAPHLSKSYVWSQALILPWYIYAVGIAATSIVVGLLWDISWHMTIGRDAFLSPPHIAIYVGGLIAGFGGGYLMIKTTFFATAEEKARSVWFWGFRSPLAGLLLVWGALAMLTSAPFDDWWHNAYGLDVKILSPPHALLGLGLAIIQLGSVICLLAFQNRLEAKRDIHDPIAEKKLAIIRFLYTYCVGMLIAIVAIVFDQYTAANMMHSSIFYQVSGMIFPIFLVAASKASGMKWPATSATAVYMGVHLLMIWVLPLFPATPKLGPVLTQVDHFFPFRFPLLLIVPAIAMDLVMRKTNHQNGWLQSLWLALTFFVVFFVTHWFFGIFYFTDYARNSIFVSGVIPYYSRPDYKYLYEFVPWDKTTGALVYGMVWAFGYTFLSSRLGLWWGKWMRRVQR